MPRIIFFLAVSIFSAAQILGADTPEADDAFKAAAKAFQDKIYDRAEKQFEEFAAKYPQSPRGPEVILLQAQCRFERMNFSGAAELLNSRRGAAGDLGDQYLYWIAEARFHEQKPSAASEVYAELLRTYPNSPLRLRAGYGEAFSHFKLDNFPRAVELLKDPAAAFQQAARMSTNDTEVVRGYLLLGEALRAQKNYRAVEEALLGLANRKLAPDLDWQREYLLANSQLADGRPEDALEKVTNLVVLAAAATNPVLQASSLMFQAAILESNRPEAAIQTYERITEIKDVSASQSRQAILKIVDLMMAQNRLTNAIQRLKTFVGTSPQDPSSGLLRLTLGELHLKQFYSLAETVPKPNWQTNLAALSDSLQQAKTNFDFIINLRTNAHDRELAGKAHLDRGWCRWEESRFAESPAKLLESQQDFQAAVGHLPVSEDQAIARIKWADCQFELRDYTNAMTNYKLVIENYADLPQVKTNLFGQALDHILRSSIEVNDFDGAQDAMEKNLAWFPKSPLGHQGVLTYAMALLNRNKPVEAREALIKFQQGWPDSPLLPEIQLALARTFVEQTNWPAAMIEYDRWVIHHTNHHALSLAEFDRAWVYYQHGNETNAFRLFTNYVTRFAASPMAPLAKYWVAEYYYRHNDPHAAELNYKDKILLQNTNLPFPDLSYQSRLMTSKAAFMRQDYAQARGYLNDLIPELERMDDTNSPRALLSEAYLVFGDIVLTDSAPGATNALKRFEEAINIFKRARRPPATNRLALLATGKIADCLSQLHRHAEATAEYRNIISSPLAGVAIRSQAEVGLAEVLENQAGSASTSAQDRKQLLELALNHYLNVFHGKNLAPGKNEKPEPFWVKKAGIQAASVAEKLQRVPEAIGIYFRLVTELPSLRPAWENKIESLNRAALKK